jgi:hypothetical protein
MSLTKKYGISEAQIKAMYMGGDLPCSVFRREQIVNYHKKQLDLGLSKTEAVRATADEFRITPEWVWRQLKMAN